MGRIRQLGTPKEIYETPADAFVADFIGSSNFLTGTVVDRAAGIANVRLEDGTVIKAQRRQERCGRERRHCRASGTAARSSEAPARTSMRQPIQGGSYLGSVYQYELTGAGSTFPRPDRHARSPTSMSSCYVPPEASTLFAAQSRPQA